MNIALTRLSTRALGGLAQRVVKSSKNGKFKIVEEHELLKSLEKESKEFEDLYGKLTYSSRATKSYPCRTPPMRQPSTRCSNSMAPTWSV